MEGSKDGSPDLQRSAYLVPTSLTFSPPGALAKNTKLAPAVPWTPESVKSLAQCPSGSRASVWGERRSLSPTCLQYLAPKPVRSYPPPPPNSTSLVPARYTRPCWGLRLPVDVARAHLTSEINPSISSRATPRPLHWLSRRTARSKICPKASAAAATCPAPTGLQREAVPRPQAARLPTAAPQRSVAQEPRDALGPGLAVASRWPSPTHGHPKGAAPQAPQLPSPTVGSGGRKKPVSSARHADPSARPHPSRPLHHTLQRPTAVHRQHRQLRLSPRPPLRTPLSPTYMASTGTMPKCSRSGVYRRHASAHPPTEHAQATRPSVSTG